MSEERICVVGLGYVGLPVAIALAGKYENVTGFDISEKRVEALKGGTDWTGEIADAALRSSSLKISSDPADLKDASFYIVTVPTPIDAERRPDLGPIRSSCELLGPRLSKGAIVVFESTVYPGVTEDFCGPLLERESGLERGVHFFLGYSPERINPGDKDNRLESIVKVVSAEDEQSLARVSAVYGGIIDAGLHRAPSIKVAEAAKVIENTQRDVNIALMNELSLIFDRMGIRTSDVIEAAASKWNFLSFTPGLVGGHCIGVDPYYLTSAAERLGYRPEMILSGRRINDGMGAEIARKAIKLMIAQSSNIRGATVGVLGLTFKEDVPDLRNSKVPDIVSELRSFGVNVLVNDPHASAVEAANEYGLVLSDLTDFENLNAVIYAVPHAAYDMTPHALQSMTADNGVIVDVKSKFSPIDFPDRSYWSL